MHFLNGLPMDRNARTSERVVTSFGHEKGIDQVHSVRTHHMEMETSLAPKGKESSQGQCPTSTLVNVSVSECSERGTDRIAPRTPVTPAVRAKTMILSHQNRRQISSL